MKQLLINKNSGQIIEIFSEHSIITETEYLFTDGKLTVYKTDYNTMTKIDLEIVKFEEGEHYIEKYNYALINNDIVPFNLHDYKIKLIRKERDTLLKESDWTQVNDAPFTFEEKEQWKQYRQSLRDFPLYCNVDDPTYPKKPF
jgi:hypothetical protein